MEQQNEMREPQRQQSSRPVKKRRRVRYDRIFIALALVIIVFILFFSCSCSCIKCICSPSDKAESSGTENASEGVSGSSAAEATDVPVVSDAQAAISLTLTADDMHKGPLAVVNANNEYKFIDGDADLVSVAEKKNSSYTVSSVDVQLDDTAVTSLNQLLSEFSTISGKTDVQVESGYRSKQDQDSRYSSGSSIFPGGFSDYHTGRSFDLCITPDDGMQSYYVPSSDYAWIDENAHKYGFVLRYPEGKTDSTGVNPRAYTFHYTGEPHSQYMYDNNLCLEEYVETMKSYPASSPLTVDAGDAVWTVFYVELSASGSSVVNIPGCQEYTISGDNISGFIVAYH